MKKIGIILINYKDYVNRFLDECRDSIRTQNYPKELVNVYMVDNAASEESNKYIKEHYPELTAIIPRPDGNYAAANNAGIKKAKEDGCDYFVIANMDAVYNQNWLTELVKAIESDDNIGAVQSKMLLYNKDEEGKYRINSTGNIQHFLGFGFTCGYDEPDREMDGYPAITGYVSGCSFMVKREVVDIIQGYDEEYYMYHDDVDFSWKAKLAGYKFVLAPKSIMYHKYEFARSILMLYYMERNRYLAMFHFYKIPTLIIISPAILAMEGGMFFYSIVNGWFKTKLKVYGYFLKPSSWSKIRQKRKKINQIRKLKDRDIVNDFYGKVLFQEIDNPVLKHIANPIFDAYWNTAKKLIKW